ncbi:MAG: histidine phosphatase family protein [Balneolaceae bacterium]|nr:MAG: histidine phosphatase family protein [Balneolaceae bacterium]
MSKTRLFIARHGETEYNRKGMLQGRGINAPLNETGKLQAKQLSGYLMNYRSDFLASSSLLRAEQTAGFYSCDAGLSLTKNGDLDEMDFGDFEGAPFLEVLDEIKRLDTAWRSGEVHVKVPGGESPKEVFSRADEAVRNYITSHKGETLVLIVHGRLIRILLSEWLGYGLQNMHMIEHTNGAVNQIVCKNGIFEPVYLNKTEHLMILKG